MTEWASEAISKTDSVAKAENDIIEQLHKIVGYVPTGTKDLLHCLLHPDLIDLTETYLETWRELSNPTEWVFTYAENHDDSYTFYWYHPTTPGSAIRESDLVYAYRYHELWCAEKSAP